MSDQGETTVTAPKTVAKASEAAAGWPSVRAFLRSHPNLVREDADLLSDLGLRYNADNVVEFGPAALARHIDAHRQESTARQQLEATARANFSAQAQCHAGVVDLLEARNNADLARRLDETAQLRFGLTGGSLAVEGKAPAGWVSLPNGMVDMILGEQAMVRLGQTGFGALLFPNALFDIGSVALVRLALWQPASPGLLCFGAGDVDAELVKRSLQLVARAAHVPAHAP